MIVGVLQRGCGRSLPLATDTGAAVTTTIASRLIADSEAAGRARAAWA